MDAQLLLIVTASFAGGLFVLARFGRWILVVTEMLRSREGPLAPRSLALVAPVLLRSGPWSLALALTGTYFAATSSRQSNLWALLAGGLLAAAVIALGIWRSARRTPPRALTPGRLVAIRRRFFWGNSLLFAFATTGFLAYGPLDMPRSEREIIVMVGFFSGLAGGWVWSWFMWQWYGEQLKVNEQARLAREQASGP